MLRKGVNRSGHASPQKGGYIFFLHLIYDFIYFLIALGLSPYLLIKMAFNQNFRAGLLQRFGFLPFREGDSRCVWIHGVSVGEIKAAKGLVREFKKAHPEWEIVLSTTTKSGFEVARKIFSDFSTFYYPLDFSFATRRVIRAIHPAMVILMELEVWPNFLLTTSQRGIPVILVNGRISEKSYRGYRLLQKVVPEPFDRIALFCVQTQEYADRLAHLGVPPNKIHITGTMKLDNILYDREEIGCASKSLAALFRISPHDFVIVGGSTHEGEEEALVEAFSRLKKEKPSLRLILAPRHLPRLEEVEALVREKGLEVVRKTSLKRGGGEGLNNKVILLDTMGELEKIYGVANVVFVGGSLVPHGGQNMIEPAGLGKAVVFGPHVFNFTEIAEMLLEREAALQVHDGEDLFRSLARLAQDPSRVEELGQRAKRAVEDRGGATGKNFRIIEENFIS